MAGAVVVIHEQSGQAIDAPVATLGRVQHTSTSGDVAPSWAVILLQQLAAGREGACNRVKEVKGVERAGRKVSLGDAVRDGCKGAKYCRQLHGSPFMNAMVLVFWFQPTIVEDAGLDQGSQQAS